jgi:hypothetical protein
MPEEPPFLTATREPEDSDDSIILYSEEMLNGEFLCRFFPTKKDLQEYLECLVSEYLEFVDRPNVLALIQTKLQLRSFFSK